MKHRDDKATASPQHPFLIVEEPTNLGQALLGLVVRAVGEAPKQREAFDADEKLA